MTQDIYADLGENISTLRKLGFDKAADEFEASLRKVGLFDWVKKLWNKPDAENPDAGKKETKEPSAKFTLRLTWPALRQQVFKIRKQYQTQLKAKAEKLGLLTSDEHEANITGLSKNIDQLIKDKFPGGQDPFDAVLDKNPLAIALIKGFRVGSRKDGNTFKMAWFDPNKKAWVEFKNASYPSMKALAKGLTQDFGVSGTHHQYYVAKLRSVVETATKEGLAALDKIPGLRKKTPQPTEQKPTAKPEATPKPA